MAVDPNVSISSSGSPQGPFPAAGDRSATDKPRAATSPPKDSLSSSAKKGNSSNCWTDFWNKICECLRALFCCVCPGSGDSKDAEDDTNGSNNRQNTGVHQHEQNGEGAGLSKQAAAPVGVDKAKEPAADAPKVADGKLASGGGAAAPAGQSLGQRSANIERSAVVGLVAEPGAGQDYVKEDKSQVKQAALPPAPPRPSITPKTSTDEVVKLFREWAIRKLPTVTSNLFDLKASLADLMPGSQVSEHAEMLAALVTGITDPRARFVMYDAVICYICAAIIQSAPNHKKDPNSKTVQYCFELLHEFKRSAEIHIMWPDEPPGFSVGRAEVVQNSFNMREKPDDGLSAPKDMDFYFLYRAQTILQESSEAWTENERFYPDAMTGALNFKDQNSLSRAWVSWAEKDMPHFVAWTWSNHGAGAVPQGQQEGVIGLYGDPSGKDQVWVGQGPKTGSVTMLGKFSSDTPLSTMMEVVRKWIPTKLDSLAPDLMDLNLKNIQDYELHRDSNRYGKELTAIVKEYADLSPPTAFIVYDAIITYICAALIKAVPAKKEDPKSQLTYCLSVLRVFYEQTKIFLDSFEEARSGGYPEGIGRVISRQFNIPKLKDGRHELHRNISSYFQYRVRGLLLSDPNFKHLSEQFFKKELLTFGVQVFDLTKATERVWEEWVKQGEVAQRLTSWRWGQRQGEA